MSVKVAKSAGFCFGVSRSVDMAEKLIGEKGACASYGQLIHNEDVVARLAARGLRVVDQPMELRPGETVLIRAHGVAKEVYAQLEGAGGEVVDATCPKVKAIHTIVSRAADEGRFVIIIGMPRHPEVEGICGWCGAHKVFENSQELALWLDNNSDYWEKPITVVVQTTQTRRIRPQTPAHVSAGEESAREPTSVIHFLGAHGISLRVSGQKTPARGPGSLVLSVWR